MKELYSHVLEGQKSSVYPVYLVSLQLPSDEVDVNLEPNKNKVLMKHHSDVMELIRNTVCRILGRDPPAVKAVVEESLLDSSAMDQSANQTDCDIVDDEDFFRGFDEPFDLPDAPKPKQPKSITIGSAEWSKGLATDSEGRIVHVSHFFLLFSPMPIELQLNFLQPVQVLRGQPHFAKRLSDPPSSESPAKKVKLAEVFESSRIVGPQAARLEMVNGKVKKIPDSFGEYCKETRNESIEST